ncbi:ABC transporter ATP-binding protein [Clostridium sp.]|uniref:ABC transporter ATP-binding protein n=1 Tax=Clostridium sp. TaxID=1506 RepID=UPI0025C36842|nr:ABC transporter ATP-binding protein [Clostridium sp.]MBS4958460.1 ABC transporter ATP-binding protein [Clostridium sp.]MDU4884745.1 ABC transporter ATP-binding protein [Clostridium celatum]MDU7077973.1 ABC transporter ATP-binding protein [Clostridium celatum]
MTKLFKYIKGSAIIYVILAPLMMFIEVVMDLNQPKLMSDIIDIGVANGDISYVLNVGFKMILVAMLGILGGMLCGLFSTLASMKMGKNMRQGLFDKIQSLSFSEIDKFKTSSLITRLTNDVTQVQNMVMMALRGMVRSPLICLGGIIMSLTISIKLSIIFLVVIPLIVVSVILITSKSIPFFIEMQKKIDNVNLVMRENLLGVRVIKAFVIEDKMRRRFSSANDELMDISIKAQSVTILLWPLVTLIMNLSVVAILWFGGNHVNNGSLEIGKIMAFINYLVQIMSSLNMLIMSIINFSRAKVSADRINEVLDVESSIKDREDADKIGKFDVEFKDVYFKYNKDSEYVLKGISFKVLEGEKIGIIGPTGSGKSSLISLIPRLYDTTSGSVMIGNKDVRNLKINDLRKIIGVVLQDTTLFSGSIADNLRFGMEDATEEIMDSATKDAQAFEFITSSNEGYNREVGQRGKNLSGGQKQRVSIARTLIKNPKILILDDSSSALDMATEAKLQNSIKNRMKDATVFLIAQRISAVMDSDKIIVLDNGEIVAIGTHKELIKNCEIYRSIAISQLGEEVVLNV